MKIYADLYNRDRADWAVQQALLLRNGRFNAIDIKYVAEELEAIMGNSRRELHSRFRILITYLLKWQFQKDSRSLDWEVMIRDQRDDIVQLLRESPSLRRFVPEKVSSAYLKAVALVSLETGMPRSAFPEDCPYRSSQLLNDEFWPE
jgi:hypothetical protein